jgi:hypothetical protein
LDYDQPVTLKIPHEDPHTLPLADAVLTVLHAVDRAKWVGATILRDSGDRIGHERIVAIHNRDFMQRQRLL